MTKPFTKLTCPECERGRIRVACCEANDTGHACFCPPRRRGYHETACAECAGTGLVWECRVCGGWEIERDGDRDPVRCADCGHPDTDGDRADAAGLAMEDR